VNEIKPQRSICSKATKSTPRFFVWQVAWMLQSQICLGGKRQLLQSLCGTLSVLTPNHK